MLLFLAILTTSSNIESSSGVGDVDTGKGGTGASVVVRTDSALSVAERVERPCGEYADEKDSAEMLNLGGLFIAAPKKKREGEKSPPKAPNK